MGFDGDFDAWRAYVKGVKKLECGRESICFERGIRKSIGEYKQDVLEIFFHERQKKNCITVKKTASSDIRKFKSQGTIDLHGHTRNIDHTLAIFCAKSILHKINSVTIITGKGRGIVKSATEDWLRAHPEFVISFFEIRDSLGESGAFGVKLRKK